MLLRINSSGYVTGNRLGKTRVKAGAGEESKGGIWANIPAEVDVVEGDNDMQKGSGFPQLLLTGKDPDPETGEIREGDPEQPELWQEVSDFRNNVWWLNLDNPAAFFHFNQRHEKSDLWRSYHAQKTVEMVEQVHMQAEYTQKGSEERPDNWASHKAALERFEVHVAQLMWEHLKDYVTTGGGLD